MPGINWIGYSMIWAQVSVTGTGTATTSSGPSSVLMLALRRWCSSLTLSPYDLASTAVWGWLIGLGIMFLVVGIVQRPLPMLRQLFDVSGTFTLFSTAIARLRNSARMVGIVVAVTVIGWSTNQAIFFNSPQGKDDLILLLRGRSLPSLALEQGFLAALTPLRDIFLLGNMIPLLGIGTLVLFQFTSDRYSSVHRILAPRASRDSLMGTIAWGSLALYAAYRCVSLVYVAGELPLGMGIVVEVALIPILMLLADGAVLAWVLVEIRNAGLGDVASESVDLEGLIRLLPATVLGCLLVMPARYVAPAVALAFPYIPTPAIGPYGQVVAVSSFWAQATLAMRWMLSGGLVVLQALSLPALGFVGACVWSRGTMISALHGWKRLLAAEGGRLFALTTLLGLTAGGLTFLANSVVLSIPSQPWVLTAADAYAHYATLPVGFLLISSVIELGRRTLPRAQLVESEQAESANEINSSNNTNAEEPVRVG